MTNEPKNKPENRYPQHAKLQPIAKDSQIQGAFLEWLLERYALCEPMNSPDHPWMPISDSIQQLLAHYHGIDLKVLEEEKVAMLEELRGRTLGRLE